MLAGISQHLSTPVYLLPLQLGDSQSRSKHDYVRFFSVGMPSRGIQGRIPGDEPYVIPVVDQHDQVLL